MTRRITRPARVAASPASTGCSARQRCSPASVQVRELSSSPPRGNRYASIPSAIEADPCVIPGAIASQPGSSNRRLRSGSRTAQRRRGHRCAGATIAPSRSPPNAGELAVKALAHQEVGPALAPPRPVQHEKRVETRLELGRRARGDEPNLVDCRDRPGRFTNQGSNAWRQRHMCCVPAPFPPGLGQMADMIRFR